jgi:uncharacterized protein (DUF2141 family)
MIRRLFLYVLFAFIFSAPVSANRLKVKVTGLKPAKSGALVVDVWRSAAAKDYPDFTAAKDKSNGLIAAKPCTWGEANFGVCRKTAAIKAANTEVAFEGVPAGAYAVAVFHDEDRNYRLNFDLLGLPMEGGGLSNIPSSSLTAGFIPSFARSKFDLQGDRDIVIQVKYRD